MNTKGYFIKQILPIGLLVGSLDILVAMALSIIRDSAPLQMLRHIASALFGPEAFQPGIFHPLMGLALHYLIAMIWTVLFHWAHTRFKFPHKDWVWRGVGYGILVWTAMTFLVLPLSRLPAPNPAPGRALIGIVVLVLCLGLPLARHFRGGS